jgi:ABC-2 type transport system permease protein
MRLRAFASRTGKELLRDPLNLCLSLGLPVFMLILLSILGKNIPGGGMFRIDILTPGIVLFSFTFTTLFVGFLIAQDRTGSFFIRLSSSPLTAPEFYLGYTLPVLPITVGQTAVCILAGFCFGLEPSARLLLLPLVMLPAAVFFIAAGLIFGCYLPQKAVGGIGSLFVNIATIFAGVWFPLDALEGSVFYKICHLFPFVHIAKAGACAVSGNFSALFPHLLWVCGYAAVFALISVLVFSRRMRIDKI